MHRQGPKTPDSNYFVYTGNTTYGIQIILKVSYFFIAFRTVLLYTIKERTSSPKRIESV